MTYWIASLKLINGVRAMDLISYKVDACLHSWVTLAIVSVASVFISSEYVS